MKIKEAWDIIAGFNIELVEQYSRYEYDRWRVAVNTIKKFLQPILNELNELGTMFGKKNDTNDRYFQGIGEGKAKAYSMIHDVIERNLMEDPKAVLIAIKLVCEHELLDNPYVRNVTLFKSKPKEL